MTVIVGTMKLDCIMKDFFACAKPLVNLNSAPRKHQIEFRHPPREMLRRILLELFPIVTGRKANVKLHNQLGNGSAEVEERELLSNTIVSA